MIELFNYFLTLININLIFLIFGLTVTYALLILNWNTKLIKKFSFKSYQGAQRVHEGEISRLGGFIIYFWFFIAFNKTYTTVFSYPINYKYNKEKLIPVNKLTQYVEISLTGQGWNLLKEYFSIDKRDIDIELPNEPGKTVVNEAQFIASASNIFKNVTINSVFSDSIFCNLDYKISNHVQ